MQQAAILYGDIVRYRKSTAVLPKVFKFDVATGTPDPGRVPATGTLRYIKHKTPQV